MSNSSEAIGQTPTSGKRPHSKILVDGGDPQETRRIRQLIGFVDGQTTNPSLIAKNPEIIRLIESGQRLTEQEEAAEYKKDRASNFALGWRCRRFYRSVC
jgi:transaldolase